MSYTNSIYLHLTNDTYVMQMFMICDPEVTYQCQGLANPDIWYGSFWILYRWEVVDWGPFLKTS